jgi:biotin operon repressor
VAHGEKMHQQIILVVNRIFFTTVSGQQVTKTLQLTTTMICLHVFLVLTTVSGQQVTKTLQLTTTMIYLHVFLVTSQNAQVVATDGRNGQGFFY